MAVAGKSQTKATELLIMNYGKKTTHSDSEDLTQGI